MKENHFNWRNIIFSDTGILVLLAIARILLQTFTNAQYGFHRDELAMLDDARRLAAGYVPYPPFTAWVTRLGLDLFGPSLVGIRFFAILPQGISMVLTGLMVRRLGGERLAQVMAALAMAFAPITLSLGHYMMYVAYDFLWWVCLALGVVSLLSSENPRWWLLIGAAIGMGMMTKFTMGFYVLALVVATLLTGVRRYLKSPWLWGAVGLAFIIYSPNLIWQIEHNFVTFEFLSFIHGRDIEWGRTASFLPNQLMYEGNPVTLLLIGLGLYFYMLSQQGRKYRFLGWMFIFTFVIIWGLQGRDYYLSPAYPALVAGGAVYGGLRLGQLPAEVARGWEQGCKVTLGVSMVIICLLVFPLWPVNSPLWNVALATNGEIKEELGWEELVQTVAGVYQSIPEDERATAGILAGNYGEAGAINLYGPALGLPPVICGANSYFLRGYGDPPPQTLVVVGYQREDVNKAFEDCSLAGHISNSYGVMNEEASWHPDVFLCRKMRLTWPELWPYLKTFG